MNTVPYEKLRTSMLQRLKGMAAENGRYNEVVSIFHFVNEIHRHEVRKDGITPGFYHQLSGLAYLMTHHKALIDPVAAYGNILIHDTIEDYANTRPIIREKFPDFYENAELISKYRENYEGKLPLDMYFASMPDSFVVSVTKPVDRFTNLSTMQHLSIEKQKENIKEVYDFFFPMMKQAGYNFPQQEMIYEQLKSAFHVILPIMEQRIQIAEELATTSKAYDDYRRRAKLENIS